MRLLTSVALLLFVHTNAAAQSARGFIQVDAGFGYGVGGETLRAREAFSLEAMGGTVRQPAGTVMAVSLSALGGPGSGNVCELTPSGVCSEEFPIFYSVAGLIGRGWNVGRGLSNQALVGPSLHHADDGGTALGASTRLQLNVRLAGPVSVALGGKAAFIPNYRGDGVGLFAVALGFAFMMPRPT